MAADTAISWCDSTWNPWIGCTRVSPGCDHCYAAVSTPARTLNVTWGVHEPRRRTSEANWQGPRRWEKAHETFTAEHGRRRRVFCASLADVFDRGVHPVWRAHVWTLIRETPHLDWLLLTKRVGNVPSMLPRDWGDGYQNVWLGITVVNQHEADHDIPKLLQIPAVVHWISAEPLLGAIDLEHVQYPGKHKVDVLRRGAWDLPGWHAGFTNHSDMDGIDWVVAGGESGPHARPANPDWFRSLRNQCKGADIPFFFKQIGGKDKTKGGDLLDGAETKEWPHNTKESGR